jgi:mannonate dehydratase
MKETWRWFGPDDTVSLDNILQAGASGVVTALDHIETGQIWPIKDIDERNTLIKSAGLEWSVVESVPVHHDIKTRSGSFQNYIENYKQSIRNIGSVGISTICYNFMPILDWTRTDLSFSLPNRSQALRFDMIDFATYDVFILQRDGAAKDYSEEILAKAGDRIHDLNDEDALRLEKNIIAGLPGGEGSYDRSGLSQMLSTFDMIDRDSYQTNLHEFLESIIPVAEESGVRMAIHPDDPPFSLFGLPRVVSTADDLKSILDVFPSPSNGITFCSGSLGTRADNDLLSMVREFGANIFFVHLRNIIRQPNGSFHESEHLNGMVDMVSLVKELITQERKQNRAGKKQLIPMRPDHGHTMASELGNRNIRPGYSFCGRMKGLAELRGVSRAISGVDV